MAVSSTTTARSKSVTDDEKIDNLSRARGWFEALKGDRFVIERDNFYRPQRAYRGFLFDVYNKYDRTIQTPQPKRGEVRLPIPMVKTMVDLNTLEMTKDDPTFEVVPESNDDDDVKQTKLLQMHLDALYKKCGLKEKFRQVAKSGLITSVGILEVYFNSELEGGGEVECNVIRPEDFYIGMNQQDPDGAPIVGKVFRKNLEYIKNSKLYKDTKKDWEHELHADDDDTESDASKRIQQDTYGTTTNTATNKNSSGDVLLVECYQRYYPENATKPKYRILTFSAKQGILLRYEDTDLDRPPFFVFHSDQHLGEFYGIGKVQPIIPLVKALSNLQSRLQEHLIRFTRASLMVPRGAQLFRTSNESGEMWLHNPGRRPEPNSVAAIPREVIEQSNMLEKYIQDSSSVHDVSMGRNPQGIESARAIENLIHGDQQNKADLRDNFESFASQVAKYMLYLCSHYYPKSRKVTVKQDGQPKQFYAVGQEGATNPYIDELKASDENVLVIKPDNDIQVNITSGLANTPEARQQKAISLNERGLLSNKSTLSYFRIGNVAEEAEAAYQDAVKAQEAQQPKPPPATIKDIVQFNADTFFTPEEKMQLKTLMFPGLKPSPAQEQDTQANTVANQMHLETHKAELQQALQEHKAITDQANTVHQASTDLMGQQAASVNPLIPGGAVDPTAGQPGEIPLMPGQAPTGGTDGGQPTGLA